jgi:UDP-2,3-diacylglucosamine pyrophosphatase LpxH
MHSQAQHNCHETLSPPSRNSPILARVQSHEPDTTTLMSRHFRTLWLSDVHLGTNACRATDLHRFLEHVSADTIYLVGDIVDLKRMKSRPHFPAEHRIVIGRLIELANHGSRIVFVPGNHDEEFRRVAGSQICGVEIRREVVHVTASGERLLTMHGDILDASIREGTNLEHFAAAVYTALLEADVRLQRLRSSFGGDFSPLSTRIKTRLSRAVQYIERFEETAAAYAASRGFDGIVCGHIHRPAIRHINGVRYANDGDWVEHRTAIAEDQAGGLLLLSYNASGTTILQDGAVQERAAA